MITIAAQLMARVGAWNYKVGCYNHGNPSALFYCNTNFRTSRVVSALSELNPLCAYLLVSATSLIWIPAFLSEKASGAPDALRGRGRVRRVK